MSRSERCSKSKLCAARAVAKAKVLNVLLPAHKRKLLRLYLYYLKLFRYLRRTPVNLEDMSTLRRFMDEESMDCEKAVEAAVDRRKFLLNRLLQRPHVPDEEEEEDTNQGRWNLEMMPV